MSNLVRQLVLDVGFEIDLRGVAQLNSPVQKNSAGDVLSLGPVKARAVGDSVDWRRNLYRKSAGGGRC